VSFGKTPYVRPKVTHVRDAKKIQVLREELQSGGTQEVEE
jgi:hypothetical protein